MHIPPIVLPSHAEGRYLSLCSCEPFWFRLLTYSIECAESRDGQRVFVVHATEGADHVP